MPCKCEAAPPSLTHSKVPMYTCIRRYTKYKFTACSEYVATIGSDAVDGRDGSDFSTTVYHYCLPPAAARACFSRSFGTGNNSRSLHGTTADYYYRVVLRLTDCHPRAACRTLTPVSLPVCFCRCRGFSGHTSANATPLFACLLGVVVLPFFAIDRRSVAAASSLTILLVLCMQACKLAVSLVVRAARARLGSYRPAIATFGGAGVDRAG